MDKNKPKIAVFFMLFCSFTQLVCGKKKKGVEASSASSSQHMVKVETKAATIKPDTGIHLESDSRNPDLFGELDYDPENNLVIISSENERYLVSFVNEKTEPIKLVEYISLFRRKSLRIFDKDIMIDSHQKGQIVNSINRKIIKGILFDLNGRELSEGDLNYFNGKGSCIFERYFFCSKKECKEIEGVKEYHYQIMILNNPEKKVTNPKNFIKLLFNSSYFDCTDLDYFCIIELFFKLSNFNEDELQKEIYNQENVQIMHDLAEKMYHLPQEEVSHQEILIQMKRCNVLQGELSDKKLLIQIEQKRQEIAKEKQKAKEEEQKAKEDMNQVIQDFKNKDSYPKLKNKHPFIILMNQIMRNSTKFAIRDPKNIRPLFEELIEQVYGIKIPDFFGNVEEFFALIKDFKSIRLIKEKSRKSIKDNVHKIKEINEIIEKILVEVKKEELNLEVGRIIKTLGRIYSKLKIKDYSQNLKEMKTDLLVQSICALPEEIIFKALEEKKTIQEKINILVDFYKNDIPPSIKCKHYFYLIKKMDLPILDFTVHWYRKNGVSDIELKECENSGTKMGDIFYDCFIDILKNPENKDYLCTNITPGIAYKILEDIELTKFFYKNVERFENNSEFAPEQEDEEDEVINYTRLLFDKIKEALSKNTLQEIDQLKKIHLSDIKSEIQLFLKESNQPYQSDVE